MTNINLELIAYKLEEISNQQKISQEENKKRFDVIDERLANVEHLNNTMEEFKEWKSNMDRYASVTALVEMQEWKKELDQHISPKQLEVLLKEIEQLKTFKTKAMMIWTVVQALMALGMFWDKIFT